MGASFKQLTQRVQGHDPLGHDYVTQWGKIGVLGAFVTGDPFAQARRKKYSVPKKPFISGIPESTPLDKRNNCHTLTETLQHRPNG
jgi:hypothetical protein